VACNKTDWQECDDRKPIWVIEMKRVIGIKEEDVNLSVKEICAHRAISNKARYFNDQGM
jgi:hypothetical protein